MIPKTDFVLCYFPLSKQCLSPPSSNKIILEAGLIVVAFPLNCISCSCLWDSYKFQHLCTLSFQVSLTFIEKDNIELQSWSSSPPLLPSGESLPCLSKWAKLARTFDKFTVGLLRSCFLPRCWAFINVWDLCFHLPCRGPHKYPISVPLFEGLVRSTVLCAVRELSRSTECRRVVFVVPAPISTLLITSTLFIPHFLKSGTQPFHFNLKPYLEAER